MMQLLVALVAMAATSGLGLIVEAGSAAWQFLNARIHARPRPQASPHAKAEGPDDHDDEETTCN